MWRLSLLEKTNGQGSSRGFVAQIIRKVLKVGKIELRWYLIINFTAPSSLPPFYLYPDLTKTAPTRPLSGFKSNIQQPFNVSLFKQDKDKHIVVLPKRVIELLKINEKRRTPEQSQHIAEHLSLIEQLESCFTKSQFNKFGKVAWFDSFGPCRVLIRQDQFADCFYLILSGKVNFKTRMGESSLLGPGDVFGLEELIQDELAPEGSPKFKKRIRNLKTLRRLSKSFINQLFLISFLTRQATYVTQTPVTVACVHRCDFESRHTDIGEDSKRALQSLNDSSNSTVEMKI